MTASTSKERQRIQMAAGSAVQIAIKAERLPHPTTLRCTGCGAPAAEYHHHLGYAPAHRLDVVPYCHDCHLLEHMRLRRGAKPEPTEWVAVADQWRQSLHLSHVDFVAFLGRDLTEWSHLRSGRRKRSLPFLGAVWTAASVAGGPWLALLEAAYLRDVMARVAI